MQLLVDKIVSESPLVYNSQDLESAIDRYGAYCRNLQVFSQSPKLSVVERNAIKFKSFDQWLKTEI